MFSWENNRMPTLATANKSNCLKYCVQYSIYTAIGPKTLENVT